MSRFNLRLTSRRLAAIGGLAIIAGLAAALWTNQSKAEPQRRPIEQLRFDANGVDRESALSTIHDLVGFDVTPPDLTALGLSPVGVVGVPAPSDAQRPGGPNYNRATIQYESSIPPEQGGLLASVDLLKTQVTPDGPMEVDGKVVQEVVELPAPANGWRLFAVRDTDGTVNNAQYVLSGAKESYVLRFSRYPGSMLPNGVEPASMPDEQAVIFALQKLAVNTD